MFIICGSADITQMLDAINHCSFLLVSAADIADNRALNAGDKF
jgi:hypothetical protein